VSERCSLCGCPIHRNGDYAKRTIKGRSHATAHHFVAERFYGRTKNRPGVQRERILEPDPWQVEDSYTVFCYECHEELLHNPVFLPHDIEAFSRLVKSRGLDEETKPENRKKIAGRIQLLNDVIHRGLSTLLDQVSECKNK
jgi:hypothetical protein